MSWRMTLDSTLAFPLGHLMSVCKNRNDPNEAGRKLNVYLLANPGDFLINISLSMSKSFL